MRKTFVEIETESDESVKQMEYNDKVQSCLNSVNESVYINETLDRRFGENK